MERSMISNLAMADIFRQLAMLMHAGVTLCDGCSLIAEEESNKKTVGLLQELAQQLQQGASFAQALRESGAFPKHIVGLLEMGERAGRTEKTLLAVAEYYEEQHALKNYLRNAITYPMMLLMLMLVVVVVLLTKVMPVFDDIYASLGGSLSGVAGSLLALGGWLSGAMPALIRCLMVVVAVVLLCMGIAPVRIRISNIWQKLFGDRGVGRKIQDARFAEAMALGLSSGMDMDSCFALAAELLEDVPKAAARCLRCKELMDEGKDLAEAMKRAGMLPAASCRMLVLGMRSGAGDDAMAGIAKRLSEDARQAVRVRIAGVEPALVVITSLMVGAILLSVMLPLMNIMKAIG